MAKRICGATDRLDQAGLLGSCRCVWRAAPSPPPRILPEILQRSSHALIAEQGCTGFACGPDPSSRRFLRPALRAASQLLGSRTVLWTFSNPLSRKSVVYNY